jgi:pyridoxal phosphate enzyme (YggS family)
MMASVNNDRIALTIQAIQNQIAEAAIRSGRNASDCRLVAVSKTVGVEEIAQAIKAGLCDFAENRTDLFSARQAQFPEVNWHFIGRIQTNKIKDFAGKAALVHSVASARALLGIDRRAEVVSQIQPVLIEVNVSGEDSKDGVTVDELPDLLSLASSLEHLTVEGLMTIAPIAGEATVRDCFRGLREIQNQVQLLFVETPRINLRELSMGMSDDFQIAVEEGATIVRIGRSVWQ